MNRLVDLAHRIDKIMDWIGKSIAWLVVATVLVGAYNALARYSGRFLGFNLSSNLYLELQWYMFSVLFLLGAAYALRHDAHVRVDVWYGRVSQRMRALVNVIGTIVFLIPFSVFAIWVSWPSVRNSWSILEGSPDPGGLPRYPLKTMVIVGFVLLLIQGFSELIKNLATLREPSSDDNGGDHHDRLKVGL